MVLFKRRIKMIKFNIPPFIGKEQNYVTEVIKSNLKLCGDGPFTQKCNTWFEENFESRKALLTTSCTHALEMAAILANIMPGDEVIAPSFTFVSTVNAFALRGAKIVFVDIRPDTMNLDEKLIEDAITNRTKVIVPVHYAGVACEMDKIIEIASKHNIIVVEDAAQGVMSKYKGQALGTIGDFGAYSFHETKNYTMGEGGALLIQNKEYIERAEIIREKGTNRSKFFRGQVDKYSWVDLGSSYLPSELNAAYLYAQLEEAEMINKDRMKTWNSYYEGLKDLKSKGVIELPVIPSHCEHNAHMFYIKCKDLDERTKLINYLKDNEVLAVFHYIPLHSSEAGKKYGIFHGEDKYTTLESERLLRLPLYYGLKPEETRYIYDKINSFYSEQEQVDSGNQK
jgi:TDP-4-keto-6-deoxy-D-glucose transaminase